MARSRPGRKASRKPAKPEPEPQPVPLPMQNDAFPGLSCLPNPTDCPLGAVLYVGWDSANEKNFWTMTPAAADGHYLKWNATTKTWELTPT